MEAKLIFLISFLLGMVSFSSCEKKNLNILPPETQTGKDTFGFFIDGKLFTNFYDYSYILSIYDREMKVVTISMGQGRYNFKRLYLYKFIGEADTLHVYTNPPYTISSYVSLQFSSPPTYVSSDMNNLIITKFDTINEIISGRFNFILYSDDNKDESVAITNGRFDSKLLISN